VQEYLARILDDKNERRTLIAVSLSIFVLQLLTLRSSVINGEPLWIAYYMRQGLGFVFTYPWNKELLPTSYITPLYPYFLYSILTVGGGLVAMQISGLLFFQVANFFLYGFFKRHLSKKLAFGGFLALGFYLPLWFMAQKIDPDALNLMLVAITIFILDGFRRSATIKQWIVLGVIYGIQLLVRPDILVGLVFFGIWLATIIQSKTQFLKGYALSIGIMLLCVLPWTIRNYQVFHSFVLVSSNAGFNFYMGNNPRASGEFQLDTTASTEAIADDSLRTKYFAEHTSDVERDSYLMRTGLTWVKTHPAEAAWLWVKKFFYHWGYRESTGSNIMTPRWMIVTYSMASLLLVILGLYGLFQIDKPAKWLLISLFAYSTVISTVFFVQSRHRAIKVDPYLITLSVVGITTIVSKRSKLRT
jgi:hypothetical protein